jgi:hypothetical protein
VSIENRSTAASALAIPKVDSITIGGVPLDPNAQYKVALSDGLLLAVTLANQMLHLGVDLSDMQDSGLQAWQAVVNYVTQVGHLTIHDFGVGGHSFTQSPDLGVYYYAMDWDGTNLTVEVQNQGLQTSAPGTLNCSTGLPNDLLAYNTEIQQWTALPIGRVPAIQPGVSISVAVPWSSAGLAKGYWPVQCTINSAGDGYSPNNSAQKVFKI